MKTTNDRLRKLYLDWRESFDTNGIDIQKLEPPLLLSDFQQRTDKSKTIMFVGRETLGWRWNNNYRAEPERKNYPEEYIFSDELCFADFLKNADSVDALMWAYEQFNFSKYQRNKSSFFWQAFRKVQSWKNACVIYTNLSRCAYDGSSILAYDDHLKFFDRERGLLEHELGVFDPHAVLFFTGYKYDNLLRAVFPGVELTSLFGEDVHKIARVVDPRCRLPTHSYRMYHPQGLSGQGRWTDIDRVHDLIYG